MNREKMLYTVLCNCNHIVYGIILHIFASTLVDLQHIYSVSVDSIAYVPMARTCGFMAGSMIGWTYKWLNRQLTVSLLYATFAITVALTPFNQNFALLLVCVFFCGLGGGCWISTGGAWLIEMWPRSNSAILQFFEFMYGCGTILSPLLATPFVYGKLEFDVRANRTISVDDRVRSLTTPFVICGAAGLIASLTLTILYFVRPYRKIDESNKSTVMTTEMVAKDPVTREPEAETPETSDDREHTPYRLLKLTMCGLAVASIVAAEIGWFAFASTLFQNLPIALSASDGARMMAIFSTSFTLSRLFTAFVALKLSPDIIISYHLAIVSAALATLYIGRDSETIIFVANGVLGFGYSAMWSGLFAFTERHLRLSDRICSTFTFLIGFMSLVIPLVLGQTFERYPRTLFALQAGLISICIILFVTVRCWIWLDRKSSK